MNPGLGFYARLQRTEARAKDLLQRMEALEKAIEAGDSILRQPVEDWDLNFLRAQKLEKARTALADLQQKAVAVIEPDYGDMWREWYRWLQTDLEKPENQTMLEKAGKLAAWAGESLRTLAPERLAEWVAVESACVPVSTENVTESLSLTDEEREQVLRITEWNQAAHDRGMKPSERAKIKAELQTAAPLVEEASGLWKGLE